MKNKDKSVQYAEVWRGAHKVGGGLSDDCYVIEVQPREKRVYRQYVVC